MSAPLRSVPIRADELRTGDRFYSYEHAGDVVVTAPFVSSGESLPNVAYAGTGASAGTMRFGAEAPLRVFRAPERRTVTVHVAVIELSDARDPVVLLGNSTEEIRRAAAEQLAICDDTLAGQPVCEFHAAHPLPPDLSDAAAVDDWLAAYRAAPPYTEEQRMPWLTETTADYTLPTES